MRVCCTFHPLGLDVVEVLAQREVPDGAVLGQPHQQGGQIHVQTYKQTTSGRFQSRRLSASRECSPVSDVPTVVRDVQAGDVGDLRHAAFQDLGASRTQLGAEGAQSF